MLNSVTVINYLGDGTKMILRRPELSGFLIKSIDGVSAGKATVNMTDAATKDGEYYNSSKIQSRNITLKIELLPAPTIEDTRHELYKYFQVKRNVQLIFETDSRTCYIDGYVESNEIEIFSEKESAQISVICPDPHFYELNTRIDMFSGIAGNLEFPFEKDSSDPLDQEFGIVEMNTSKNVSYYGEDETGIRIVIDCVGNVGNIVIFNELTHESMTIDADKIQSLTGSKLKNKDQVVINTNKGQKSITLIRGADYINILNCVNRDADWFQIANGENVFTYYSNSGIENLQFSIEHNALYNGI